MLWVWSANRNDPVVLADSDGRIAWQTDTADKGVTGISMQPNRNLVLHDKDGRFVWQSFNYPSDGLLVGQLLMHSRSKKLVSRNSEMDSRDGPYSLVIGKNVFIIYQNKSGTLVRYAGWEASGLHNVKFDSVQQDEPTTATYFLTLGFANEKQAEITTSTPTQPPFIDMSTRYGRFPPRSPESEAPAPAPAEMALPQLRPLQRRIILAKVYFGVLTRMQMRANINYSFLWLEPDGNLKVHNFYTWPDFYSYWDDSCAVFGDTVGQCALGSKCGASCVLLVQSTVPRDKTFRFVNQGVFGGFKVEYSANYRTIRTVYKNPFGLYFYNSTPNVYILAIGAGPPNAKSMMRWVWDANRNDPVHEKATLTFGSNGNLVLADFDGRIVWQTNTANKGVTGISMQPNGNLVLHDKYGKFVWQSFDHPSDTLLRGQSLKLDGVKNLVSRTANENSRDGLYSIQMDQKGFIMYINDSDFLLLYAGWEAQGLSNVTFDSVHEDPLTTTHILTLGFAKPFTPSKKVIVLKKIKNVNYAYSFLRLESDGNLRVYACSTQTGCSKSYAFFGDTVQECTLESKCGSTAFCDPDICTSCPSMVQLGCIFVP
ncbi:hypothetical protein MKX01_007849 [Papaver californicum]|nr:hypothetical protein MKX01_007849 [Papaver californicum]